MAMKYLFILTMCSTFCVCIFAQESSLPQLANVAIGGFPSKEVRGDVITELNKIFPMGSDRAEVELHIKKYAMQSKIKISQPLSSSVGNSVSFAVWSGKYDDKYMLIIMHFDNNKNQLIATSYVIGIQEGASQ